MPQCQFLFSAVFDSRKVTKEIFPESEKEVILRSFIPEESRSQKEAPGGRGAGGPTTCPGAPLSGRAQGRCGPPEHLPAPPFRLLIPPGLKTLKIVAKSREKVRRRRQLENQVSGTEVSVPAPCRDGEVPPEGSPSTPPPSSSPLLTPMMRSEYFSLGLWDLQVAMWFISLSYDMISM